MAGRDLANAQEDIDRVQEFRKCIGVFSLSGVCHVLRDHQMHDRFIGPRFLIYAARLGDAPLIPKSVVAEFARSPRDRVLQHHEMLAPRFVRRRIEITDNGIFR